MNNDINELNNKLDDLNKRLAKLETIEKRRKTTKIVKLLLRAIILVVICIFIYKGYKYVNDNYIKPFNEIKEKLNIDDYFNNTKNSIKKYFE